MSSPTGLTTANAMLEPGNALKAFLANPAVAAMCRATRVNWTTGTLTNAPSTVGVLLRRIGAVRESDENRLTPLGLRVLGRLQVDLVEAVKKSSLGKKFEIFETIGHGSSSIAVKASNRLIKRTVVLKLLRPTLPETAMRAIESLGALEGIRHLVAPIDSHHIDVSTSAGDRIRLYCVVFPFVQAVTLEDYLRARPPVTPFFFDALIRQVGGVLHEIETRGLSHGDLHGGNILVRTEVPRLEFVVIDPSPGLGDRSPFAPARSDFTWFKEHVTAALLSLQRHLSSMSIQKHLGPNPHYS